MPASISKHVGTRPLLKKIKKLLGVNPPISFPPPSPDAPFFAIGDVHGRLDLLDKVLDQLQPGPTLVLVGDYVDRGENSAGVLRRLFELSQDGTREVICLKGNHEDMMLRFLDDKLFGARRGDSAPTEIAISPEERGGWRVEEEFINAIRAKELVTRTTFEVGVQYMEFTEAVARSMATGNAVPLPLEEESGDGGRA